jgi:hypothetical protein
VTETQKYTVVAERPGFEVRRYDEHVVADVTVPGPAESAGNRAFGPLVGYIGGANDTRRAVSMTAPVLQQSAAEGRSIAMTAPVLQQATDSLGESLVSFVMPAGESLQTLPAPENPNVTLRAVPEQFMAAVQYSGRWTQGSYDEHALRLRQAGGGSARHRTDAMGPVRPTVEAVVPAPQRSPAPHRSARPPMTADAVCPPTCGPKGALLRDNGGSGSSPL